MVGSIAPVAIFCSCRDAAAKRSPLLQSSRGIGHPTLTFDINMGFLVHFYFFLPTNCLHRVTVTHLKGKVGLWENCAQVDCRKR